VDAGGATFGTGTGGDQVTGLLQQRLDDFVSSRSQPDSSRVAVVDEDRRLFHLGVKRNRDPADVIAVTQGEQGKHADQGMFHRMNTTHEVPLGGLDTLDHCGFDLDPEPYRLEGLGRQLEGIHAQQFLREQAPFLIADNGFGHFHPSQAG